MARVSKDFFRTKGLYFIGYSRKTAAFCDMVREAFMEEGAEVYPVNPNFGDEAPIKVYASPEEVEARPDFAYVLTNKARTAGLVEGLAALGVKRILFQSKMSVDKATLERCGALGMQTAVACPMMALGGGFHRFHGWLAGVRG